jgi:hypothetical protein
MSVRLSYARRLVVARLADLMLPGPAQGFPDPRALDVVGGVEDWLGALHPLHRRGLVHLFDAFEALPLGFGFGARLSKLDDESGTRFLRRLERSRPYALRTMLTAAKAAVMLVYYADPRVEAHVGYADDCLDDPRSAAEGA